MQDRLYTDYREQYMDPSRTWSKVILSCNFWTGLYYVYVVNEKDTEWSKDRKLTSCKSRMTDGGEILASWRKFRPTTRTGVSGKGACSRKQEPGADSAGVRKGDLPPSLFSHIKET